MDSAWASPTRLGVRALSLSLLLTGAAHARCEDYVPQARPQNAGRDIVGQDLDQIEERGFITFAVYDDFHPWSWTGENGPEGVDVEIGRLIAEALGVKARFRMSEAGETIDTDLRVNVWQGLPNGGGVVNVMMHVPYDSEYACRVDQVVFTGQYAEERIAVAYRTDVWPEDDAPVPANFRFDPVGVENDSLSDFFLSTFAGGAVGALVHRYHDYPDAMDALAAGEVAAVMGPKAHLEAGIAGHPGVGLAVHEPPLPGLARGTWTVGVAVHTAYRSLGYAVDDAIASALDDGRMEAIFARHGLTLDRPDR